MAEEIIGIFSGKTGHTTQCGPRKPAHEKYRGQAEWTLILKD